MNISIKGKNLQITPDVEEYLNKRIAKLGKHFVNIKNVTANFLKQKTNITLEITLEGDNILLRGEEKKATETKEAIDLVVEKLDTQAAKFKGKKYGKKKILGSKIKEEIKENTLISNTEVNDDLPGITKVKEFAMKPMTLDEAIEQMELSHHNFFMFLNSENEKHCVVYKRYDGDYGLIEPV